MKQIYQKHGLYESNYENAKQRIQINKIHIRIQTENPMNFQNSPPHSKGPRERKMETSENFDQKASENQYQSEEETLEEAHSHYLL